MTDMTDDEKELALLARDIDDARDRLVLFRRLLAEQLAPHGGTAEVVEALIAGCDEWGADHVRHILTTTPASYNLTELPPARLAIVGPLVTQLADASYDFDNSVVARESNVCRQDPTRERVYPFYGREAVLDRAAKRLLFIDAPSATEPLDIVEVPNRAPPTREPDAEPIRTRRRRRERDL